MARARGANAQLIGKFESTYGIDPGGSDFIKFPFVSNALGAEQPLLASDILGQGRDPAAPSLDLITADGDLVVPVDDIYMGYWLKLAFGSPTTTVDTAGEFLHEFRSGASTLPSMVLEKGFPDTDSGDYFKSLGVKANSLAFEFLPRGLTRCTVNLIAQTENDSVSVSVDSVPTELTYRRFGQYQGSIKQNGVALGNVTRASLLYSNNLDRVEVIRDDKKIAGADEGVAEASGEIVTRFTNAANIALATAGTPVEFEFALAIAGGNSLVLTAHEIYLPRPKLAVTGPGGIEATFSYLGAKDPVIGRMMTAVLTNNKVNYT